MDFLSPHDESLIASLRSEATEVKECFTKFSFQAIGLAVAVIGYMSVHPDSPMATATGTTAVICLLIATARIGTHKYHTANRNYAFELYLRRAAQHRSDHPDPAAWPNWAKPIGWEEAMRAWRVVQATFFERTYYCNPLPNLLRRKIRRERRAKWFEPEELVKETATYHAGTYLGTIHWFLFLLSFIALVPTVAFTAEAFRKSLKWESRLGLLFAILAFMFVLGASVWNAARRAVLERGLLCIPSSAIMWQAVVAAHHHALMCADGDPFKPEYSIELGRQAADLSKNPLDTAVWIAECSVSSVTSTKERAA